jgi:hypothetical protein
MHICLDIGNLDICPLVFLLRLENLLLERGSSPLGDLNLFHLGRELVLLVVDVGPRKLPFELLDLGVLVTQGLCLRQPDHRGFPDVFEIWDNLLLLCAHALRCREVLTDRIVFLLKLL